MSKRNVSRRTNDQEGNRREVSSTDKDVGTSENIELSTLEFEGEEIVFVEHDGKKLYPVYAVGKKLGYSEKNALEAFRNNKKFLEGNHYSLVIRRFKNAVSVPFLTGEGVLIYTARLGIDRLPEDRQNKIIRTVQFMAKAAIEVIAKKDALLSSEDLDRIGTNYKSRAGMNGLRMRIRRTRYKLHHPGRNLGVRDDIKIYEEDYLYVKGPGKLEPGWRKSCNDKEGRTLQAKQFFDMHEFMLDNLDDDTRKKNVLNHFQQYAPELITEYMPVRLETTTQAKLLTAGDV